MADKNETQEKVVKVLDEIRPYLQNDGGDVEFLELTDDLIVKVKLVGACGSCPFKIHTLKNGVEQAVKKVAPEIKEVVNVD